MSTKRPKEARETFASTNDLAFQGVVSSRVSERPLLAADLRPKTTSLSKSNEEEEKIGLASCG